MPPIDVPQMLVQSSPVVVLLLTAAVAYLFGRLRDRHTTNLSRETELLAEVRSAAVQCIAAATTIRALENSFGFSNRFIMRTVSRMAGDEVELSDEEREHKEAEEIWSNAVARLRICAPKLTQSAQRVVRSTGASYQDWESALSEFSERAADYLNPPGNMERIRRALNRRWQRVHPDGTMVDPKDAQGTTDVPEAGSDDSTENAAAQVRTESAESPQGTHHGQT